MTVDTVWYDGLEHLKEIIISLMENHISEEEIAETLGYCRTPNSTSPYASPLGEHERSHERIRHRRFVVAGLRRIGAVDVFNPIFRHADNNH